MVRFLYRTVVSMENSFETNKLLEEQAWNQHLLPWLKDNDYHGSEYTDKVDQLTKGDWDLTFPDGCHKNVDMKTEMKHTGNLFIEIWSNKSIGRSGWLTHLTDCDEIMYFFMDTKILYHVDIRKLRTFDVTIYPMKKQGKHKQANDAYGRIVPVKDLINAGIAVPVQLP